MLGTVRLTLDRISSSTANAHVPRDVIVSPDVLSREGFVIAVRVLNDKRTYNDVEDVSGRLVPLSSGDVLAGTLGSRRALQGYAGVVPDSLQAGDTIEVLNKGGVLGRCTGAHPDLGPPFRAEVLGAVLSFPPTGDRIGHPAHIAEGSVQPATELTCNVPLVLVAGTSMNSGKTVAATQIVRGLVRSGLQVGAAKLTGVALRRDALSMLDAGAAIALTFTDAGIVSTHEDDVLPAARGILNRIAREKGIDVIVAELGDGLLGDYGVSTILADPAIVKLVRGLVVCAPDQVGAWGAYRLLEDSFALKPTLIAGPATDTEVGSRFIRDRLETLACNARRDPEGLASAIRSVLHVTH